MEKSCRECRKFGQKLFLKGERCILPKCGLTRHANAPGTTATTGRIYRKKKSEYGQQLAEKQKAKIQYGLNERQLRKVFLNAAKASTATGETLLQRLERRLDNVVYRLGFANSRDQARQFVNHGFIRVNNKKIDIPSYLVKIKDIIEPKNIDFIKKTTDDKLNPPAWIKYDKKLLKAEIIKYPERNDIDISIDEQLIVEFYSR